MRRAVMMSAIPRVSPYWAAMVRAQHRMFEGRFGKPGDVGEGLQKIGGLIEGDAAVGAQAQDAHIDAAKLRELITGCGGIRRRDRGWRIERRNTDRTRH